MSQTIPEEKLGVVKYLAEFAVRPMFRTPVHKKPDDHGITDYEDVFFTSAVATGSFLTT